jgi:hypothetical protein
MSYSVVLKLQLASKYIQFHSNIKIHPLKVTSVKRSHSVWKYQSKSKIQNLIFNSDFKGPIFKITLGTLSALLAIHLWISPSQPRKNLGQFLICSKKLFISLSLGLLVSLRITDLKEISWLGM